MKSNKGNYFAALVLLLVGYAAGFYTHPLRRPDVTASLEITPQAEAAVWSVLRDQLSGAAISYLNANGESITLPIKDVSQVDTVVIVLPANKKLKWKLVDHGNFLLFSNPF